MKRLKIVKYPWHTGHDYELSKIPHDFYYLSTTYRSWSHSQRECPKNITWITNIDEVDADVMILHLDQWSYYEPSKRFLFLNQKKSFSGPKIVIIHGCNMKDGCTSKEMRELTDGCSVVCNSKTSEELWGLPNSRTIIHGFSSDEWPQTSYKDPTPVITLPYRERWKATTNRSFIERLEKSVKIKWIGRDYSFQSLKDYQEFMCQHSIFVNPSHASTNPRARAEAMLMGLAVVTTASHQEEAYIINGTNGYATNDEDKLIEILNTLVPDSEKIKKIGNAGMKTAKNTFGIQKFISDWEALLNDCTS